MITTFEEQIAYVKTLLTRELANLETDQAELENSHAVTSRLYEKNQDEIALVTDLLDQIENRDKVMNAMEAVRMAHKVLTQCADEVAYEAAEGLADSFPALFT